MTQFPHLNVADNISWGLDCSRHENRRRVAALMEMVSLYGQLATHWPHEISGGQQQRVALARALAQRPSLMLLDEPFSALDTGLRATTRKATADLLAQAGVASILVTHDQNEALSFASQVAVMRQGRFTQVGTPFEVYSRPADEATALFLGDALVLPAELHGGRAQCAIGALLTDNDDATGQGRVMLRPEQLMITPCQNEESAVTILDVDFSGHLSTLTLAIAQQTSLTWISAGHRVWRSVRNKSRLPRCMTVTRRCRREQRFLKYPVNLRMHWAFSSAPLTWASVASADNLSA